MSDERLLQTFLELVQIDSPSGEEAAVAAYCEDALAALGFDVRFDDSATVTGSNTGNLVAERRGTVDRTLVLSAHMDCVEPCRGVAPVVRDAAVSAAGDTVLGADDKAGIAVIIESSRRACESDAPLPTIRVILSVKEEVGLHGAKSLSGSDLEDVDLCLVLDAEGEPGGIVVGAPTHYTFVATFEGRSAHAGVAPEQGISAISLVAKAIDAMRLGRLDELTTANVGSIHGGSATNVVTPAVTITGECRSLDRSRVEALKAEMEAIMRESAVEGGGSLRIDWTREYESFALADDDPAVVLVSAACVDAGLVPELKLTGGGSDANIISALGVPTLAVSCGMKNVHSVDESISLRDLASLAALTDAVIARLAG